MAAIANAERRSMRQQETVQDRRLRHNRNSPVQTVNLLSSENEDMGAAPPQAAPQGAHQGIQPQGAPQ
eukprot:7962243-Heterocapsa_arctica.AAC.1